MCGKKWGKHLLEPIQRKDPNVEGGGVRRHLRCLRYPRFGSMGRDQRGHRRNQPLGSRRPNRSQRSGDTVPPIFHPGHDHSIGQRLRVRDDADSDDADRDGSDEFRSGASFFRLRSDQHGRFGRTFSQHGHGSLRIVHRNRHYRGFVSRPTHQRTDQSRGRGSLSSRRLCPNLSGCHRYGDRLVG